MKAKDLTPGMRVAVRLWIGVRQATVLEVNCTYKRNFLGRIEKTAAPTRNVAVALAAPGVFCCEPKMVRLADILAPWDIYEAQEQEAEIKRRTDQQAAERAYVARLQHREGVIARLASLGVRAYASGEAMVIMSVTDAERLLKGKHEA